MLDHTNHRRKLDRRRRAELDQRKRDGKDQLWCHPYWMTDAEAAEAAGDRCKATAL